LKDVSSNQQEALKTLVNDFGHLSTALSSEIKQAGEQSITLQQHTTQTLDDTVSVITEKMASTATQTTSVLTAYW
jgi:hypothetical protein